MTDDAAPSRLQLLASRLAAALVVVAGIAVLVSGIQRTSAFGGEEVLVGRLTGVTQPLVVTTPGFTDLAGARMRVRAASASVSVPVFIGVGRADDVEAYLANVARAEVTAVEQGGSLRVIARGSEQVLPDPAGVDVWAASVRAAGIATLTWPRTPGPWLLVIATDGRTPPSAADFTWTGRAGASGAPAMIAVGAVLLVLGLAALLAMRSGHVLAAMSGGRSGHRPGDRSGGRSGGWPWNRPGGSPPQPQEAAPPKRGRRAAGPPGPEPREPSERPSRSPELSPRRAARLAATGALSLPVAQPVADMVEPVAEVVEPVEPVVERVEPVVERVERVEPVEPVEPVADDHGNDDGDAGGDADGDDDGDRPPPVLPFRRGGGRPSAGAGQADRGPGGGNAR